MLYYMQRTSVKYTSSGSPASPLNAKTGWDGYIISPVHWHREVTDSGAHRACGTQCTQWVAGRCYTKTCYSGVGPHHSLLYSVDLSQVVSPSFYLLVSWRQLCRAFCRYRGHFLLSALSTASSSRAHPEIRLEYLWCNLEVALGLIPPPYCKTGELSTSNRLPFTPWLIVLKVWQC